MLNVRIRLQFHRNWKLRIRTFSIYLVRYTLIWNSNNNNRTYEKKLQLGNNLQRIVFCSECSCLGFTVASVHARSSFTASEIFPNSRTSLNEETKRLVPEPWNASLETSPLIVHLWPSRAVSQVPRNRIERHRGETAAWGQITRVEDG